MPEVWSHAAFFLALGGILALEEAGVFLLPGDISLIAAGVYVSQESSPFFVLLSWATASAGMMLGASGLFFGVRRSGTSSRVLPDRVRHLIHRHGALGVGAARMIPGLRNATVFAAAVARLSPRIFLLGLVPAALVWSGLLLAVGWYGGDTFLELYGTMHSQPWLKALSIGLVLAGATFVAFRVWTTRDEEPARAE